jgi:hypothetical protein
MDDDVIDWLNQHEYFQGLSGAILEEIASFAKVTNYDTAARSTVAKRFWLRMVFIVFS